MSKGSQPLTEAEAAKFLGVSRATVHNWRVRGLLCPLVDAGGGGSASVITYDPYELSAFKEAYDSGMTAKEMRLTVARAAALSTSTARRLDVLERMLGVRTVTLSNNPNDVRELHEEALRDSERVIRGVERVDYWANNLFGVDAVYLDLVSRVMNVNTPWEAYQKVSRALKMEQDHEAAHCDVELRMAYGALHAASDRLTSSVFDYCVWKFGVKAAMKLQPQEFESAHYEVMLLATME